MTVVYIVTCLSSVFRGAFRLKNRKISICIEIIAPCQQNYWVRSSKQTGKIQIRWLLRSSLILFFTVCRSTSRFWRTAGFYNQIVFILLHYDYSIFFNCSIFRIFTVIVPCNGIISSGSLQRRTRKGHSIWQSLKKHSNFRTSFVVTENCTEINSEIIV